MGIAPIPLLLASVAMIVGQTPAPEKVWTLTLDEPIQVSAWSSNGTCVAVATESTVQVIDRAGRPLWQWRFRDASRFLRTNNLPNNALAVSPACDRVAIGGQSDYKYVWTANRRGRRAFFETIGTPLHIKFDLRGETIAVTTAAPRGYLLSPRLDLRWSGSLGDLPVQWPGEAVKAGGGSASQFSRPDVEELFDVLSGFGRDDSISDDGQWRAAWSAPYRGAPGVGVLELWGPGADGYKARFSENGTRQPRWTKPMGCPAAMITQDGMFVIATGDPDHPQYEGFRENVCEAADLPTYVFDREGQTVLTWPSRENQDGLSEAVLARTGLPITVRQRPSWDAPLTPEEVRTLPDTRRRLVYSPDGHQLLITRDREIRLYRGPK
jgi:hypothetical protein